MISPSLVYAADQNMGILSAREAFILQHTKTGTHGAPLKGKIYTSMSETHPREGSREPKAAR